jgi:hypothetical protein
MCLGLNIGTATGHRSRCGQPSGLRQGAKMNWYQTLVQYGPRDKIKPEVKSLREHRKNKNRI